MIQKGTRLVVIDKSGIITANVFQIYKGSTHKSAKPGDFLKISAKKVRPNKRFKKGKKSKAILVTTLFRRLKKDGSYVRSLLNTCVLLRRRMTPRGRELRGPVFYGLKRRRFSSSFISKI